jgi:hypothetical protein
MLRCKLCVGIWMEKRVMLYHCQFLMGYVLLLG